MGYHSALDALRVQIIRIAAESASRTPTREKSMSKTAWNITCLVEAIVMVAIAIVSAVLGGCEMQLELANGNSAPMKCHWTFVADSFIPIIGAACALLGMTCKDASGRRAVGILLIVSAVIVALIPTSAAIGLCAMPDMHCHTTAHIVWALSALAALVGIVQVVKAKPATGDLPKRTL